MVIYICNQLRKFSNGIDFFIDYLLYLKNSICYSSIKDIVDYIYNIKLKKRKVYLYGVGRSGLVSKMFAMRLMHLNIEVYVVGEIITPSIESSDLFILISNSGNTRSIIETGKFLKSMNIDIISITSSKYSELYNLSTKSLIIPKNNINFFPMGTLFEDACLIVLDLIILELMHKTNVTEEMMIKRHLNIE